MAEFKDTLPLEALKSGDLSGFILPCFENERPLQGLTGLVDWHTIGLFSKMIEARFVTGKPGECVYIPHQYHDRTWHFILVGAGSDPKHLERTSPLPKESFQNLKKNLRRSGIQNLGWSLAEFKAYTSEEILRTFSDITLWVTR